MPRHPTDFGPPEPARDDGRLDVNAVVSYNLKAIRERRGMTQQAVADRLAQLTGHQLPQASISAMERGYDGERRRRFDAHELYLLSQVFAVPIAWFFLPPPTAVDHQLADTHRPVLELYRTLLGSDHQLAELDDRLTDIHLANPDSASDVHAAIHGPDHAVGNWHPHYRTWRRQRLHAIAHEYGDRLDQVADLLVDLGNRIQALGPDAYLQAAAHLPGEPVDDDK